MNLQEFCSKYGYAESTVSKTFPQVQRNIFNKYGIEVIKIGKGKKAQYIEKEKTEEKQMEDLKKFLDANPAVKEYFEGIEG